MATAASSFTAATDFYKLLSLDPEGAGVEDIKKAYRSMALQWHPDVCPPSRKEQSTRMFVELNRAYETLSNPVLRRKHDLDLGLGGSERACMKEASAFGRGTWEHQLYELRRRSDQRMKHKAGSWRSI